MPHSSVLYADAKFTHRTDGALLSFAMIDLSGRWFYSEIADVSVDCDPWVQANVVDKLRRIPRTKFLHAADLPACLAEWIAAPDGGMVRVKVGSEEIRSSIRPYLPAAVSIEVSAVDDEELAEYYAHSGGQSRVQHNALVDVIGVAVCDKHRKELFHCKEIQHLELLLGSKNAMSYRAWIRKHEQELLQPDDAVALAASVGASVPEARLFSV